MTATHRQVTNPGRVDFVVTRHAIYVTNDDQQQTNHRPG
jgi:hypothetical protein